MKTQVLLDITPCLRYDGVLCDHLQSKTDCLILKMKILSSSKMTLNIYQSGRPNGKRLQFEDEGEHSDHSKYRQLLPVDTT